MKPRDVVTRYLAEVVNGSGPARAEEIISNPALQQRVALIRRAFPDLEVITHDLVAESDLVAGRFTGRGTHCGLFNGVPATGREWEVSCTAIYRVVDDRIVEAWVNCDSLALMEQLGAVQRVRTVSA